MFWDDFCSSLIGWIGFRYAALMTLFGKHLMGLDAKATPQNFVLRSLGHSVKNGSSLEMSSVSLGEPRLCPSPSAALTHQLPF